MKGGGSTPGLHWKLLILSTGEVSGIPSVAVKCVDIRRNTSGEGGLLDGIMRNTPVPRERAIAMQNIANYGIPTYVTCEPLMQFDLAELVELVGMCSPQQVNIGRNSRYDITLPEPTANEVKMLKAELEKFTKVEVKANAHCWMR